MISVKALAFVGVVALAGPTYASTTAIQFCPPSQGPGWWMQSNIYNYNYNSNHIQPVWCGPYDTKAEAEEWAGAAAATFIGNPLGLRWGGAAYWCLKCVQ